MTHITQLGEGGQSRSVQHSFVLFIRVGPAEHNHQSVGHDTHHTAW